MGAEGEVGAWAASQAPFSAAAVGVAVSAPCLAAGEEAVALALCSAAAEVTSRCCHLL